MTGSTVIRKQRHFELSREDGKIYLYRNSERLKGEGTSHYVQCILDVTNYSRSGVEYLLW